MFSIYNILINCLSLINEQRGTVYQFNSSFLFSSCRVIDGSQGIFEIKDVEGFFILIELRPFIVFLFPVSHLLVFILPRRSLIAVLVVVMLSLSGGYSVLFFIELKITLV